MLKGPTEYGAQLAVTTIGKTFHQLSGGAETIGQAASDVNTRLGLEIEISDEDKKKLENFSHGVILHNHTNSNFIDFTASLSFFQEDVLRNMQYATHTYNTEMYESIFEGNFNNMVPKKSDTKQVSTRVKDMTQKLTVEGGKLPIFMAHEGLDALQAVHKRVLHGAQKDTPLLIIEVEGISGMGYGEILKGLLKSRTPGFKGKSRKVQVTVKEITVGEFLEE